MGFSFPSSRSIQNALHANIYALLPPIYSALFTQQIASHRLPALGISVWHRVQNHWDPERERGRDAERWRRAIWIEIWSIFKHFSRVLTCSDQKHPTGTGPCSHKGRPLMPLPWLPCWPIPDFPPAYTRVGAVTWHFGIKMKVVMVTYFVLYDDVMFCESTKDEDLILKVYTGQWWLLIWFSILFLFKDLDDYKLREICQRISQKPCMSL